MYLHTESKVICAHYNRVRLIFQQVAIKLWQISYRKEELSLKEHASKILLIRSKGTKNS
jgi:hypothetical protein